MKTKRPVIQIHRPLFSRLSITHYDSGVPFFQGCGGAFYTRAAKCPVTAQKIMIYASLLAMILSILAVPIYLLLAAFKKAPWRIAGVVLAPALAVIALLTAYKCISKTDDIDKAAFTTINPTTLIIFISPAAFGILTILGHGCYSGIEVK